jgi:hypothetical protein
MDIYVLLYISKSLTNNDSYTLTIIHKKSVNLQQNIIYDRIFVDESNYYQYVDFSKKEQMQLLCDVYIKITKFERELSDFFVRMYPSPPPYIKSLTCSCKFIENYTLPSTLKYLR